MKRSTNRTRHRPEEVVAKLRQADGALTKGAPIAEVARSLGVLKLERARVRWFLSVNAAHLTEAQRAKGQRTFRSITVGGPGGCYALSAK